MEVKHMNNKYHRVDGYDNQETFITVSFKAIYTEVMVNVTNAGVQINAPHEYELLLNNCNKLKKPTSLYVCRTKKNNGSDKDLTLVLKLDLNETITLNSTFLKFIEFLDPIYKEITSKYKKMKFLKLRGDGYDWCKIFDIINNGNGDTIYLCEESDIDKYKSLAGNKTVGNTLGLLLNRDIDLQYNEALETYRRHKEKQEV